MALSCKLTAPELRQRKESVIRQLKEAAIERKEMENGFAYRYLSTDKMLDMLMDFVKTERQCCDFFDFDISISNDHNAWLKISGPDGAKDFIVSELNM